MRRRTVRSATAIGFFAIIALSGSSPARADGPTTRSETRVVRVAAVGVINDQDFWKTLGERFRAKTGIRVDTSASGNKDGAAALFREGGIDLITLQSSDAIVGLVSDGWAIDPQPWLQNDLVLVGPEADPAGVKGADDLVEALRRIVKTKSPLLVHENAGANNVIREAIAANGIELPDASTIYALDDHQRRLITLAAERKAYTLISRVPFRTGKLANAGLVSMLEGKASLRRPYTFAIANSQRNADVHSAEARELATFLRSPETQAWIADFGRGKAGDASLFLPVTVGPVVPPAASTPPASAPASMPAGSLTLSLNDAAGVTVTMNEFAKLPHETVDAIDHDGKHATFSGVPLDRLLDEVNAPSGPTLRGDAMALYVVAEASDGYKVTFEIADIDRNFGDRHIIVADARGGAPLADKEGPLRLIVPQDARQGRWVRMLTKIVVHRAE